jgi:MurE/MurF fusion protein
MQRLENPSAAALWLKSRLTGALRSDSRQVRPGDGFIAWPGFATDGRRYVGAALDAGAAAVVVEQEGADAFGFTADERVAALPGLKAATGAIADAWFGSPSEGLSIVATTGTNGKTSTAWWIAQMLSTLGQRCGVIGTLGVGEPGAVEHTGLTTPDPITLHGTLRRLADQGFAACALEASSIGIVEHRLAALKIDVALFTNFTQDHLDYHGSMAAYWAAKRALFDWTGLKAASINIDDESGAALAQELAGGALDVWTVSLPGPARLRAEGLRYEGGGLVFEAVEGPARATVRSTLVGEFNANNLLVVARASRSSLTTRTRPTRWRRSSPHCARWPRRATAACGVCSAAAATATPPSAR